MAQEKHALQPKATPHQIAAFGLIRALDALQTRWNRFFDAWELTPQQYNVLRIIYVRSDEQGMPCHAISERLLTRVPDLTRLLDRLEKREWVQRFRCDSDRRVVRVRLTPKGHHLVEEIHPHTMELHRGDFPGLTKGEITQLGELLEKALQWNEKVA